MFVVGKDGTGQAPVPAGVARKLLGLEAAYRWRVMPFTIRLAEAGDAMEVLQHAIDKKAGRETSQKVQPTGERTGTVRVQVDPGAVTTGLAVVVGRQVLWGAEVRMRGKAIRRSMQARRASRRSRRARHCPYRRRHWNQKPKGWLAPSLNHNVEVVTHWIRRLCSLSGGTTVVIEMNAFDLRPEGTTGEASREANLRLAIMERDGWQCVYCLKDAKAIGRLTVDHFAAKSRGGSNRPGNLVAACRACNQAKGNRTVEDFVGHDEGALRRMKRHSSKPMAAVAAVHVVQKAQAETAEAAGYVVESGTGADTTARRRALGVEKSHWVNAACAGSRAQRPLRFETEAALMLRSSGHGSRQYQRMDRYGFPKRKPSKLNGRAKLRLGDMVTVHKPVTSRSRTPRRWWGTIGAVGASGKVDVVDNKTGKKVQASKAWTRKVGGRTGWHGANLAERVTGDPPARGHRTGREGRRSKHSRHTPRVTTPARRRTVGNQNRGGRLPLTDQRSGAESSASRSS